MRDRLVLQRVAAGRERERAERRQRAGGEHAHERLSVDVGQRRARSAPVAVGDRHAPVAAERARGDLDPGRRLAALVLGEVDEADRAVDLLLGQPLGDQLLAAVVELDVALQDPVEQLVGGQRVLVALVVRAARPRARAR